MKARSGHGRNPARPAILSWRLIVKLASYEVNGQRSIGGVVGNRILDFATAYDVFLKANEGRQDLPLALPTDMTEFLLGGQTVKRAAENTLTYFLHYERTHPFLRNYFFDIESVVLLAPVSRPQKIICVDMNYADKLTQAKIPVPSEPHISAKFANAISGPGAAVRLPPCTNQVDFGVELVVVIGKTATEIPESIALEHVAGYTIGNDLYGDDLQHRTSQWLMGKTCDGFAPMGPWLVTADEIADPNRLKLGLSLNGLQMQSSCTDRMVFKVGDIVAYLSNIFTLNAGDLIFTGTPAGIGKYRTPSVYLADGDRLRLEIEGIGALEHSMVSF